MLNLLNLDVMSFIPAIIGAGASLLGNVFGAASTRSTNSNNYRIAQMNNEWSEKMMQKQMDYNTQMWNAQNEYNSPSNQVKRLKAAGINPALALGNVSTGSAQGVSSPSLPSPSGATMQPFHPDFSSIGDSLMTAYSLEGQRKQQDAQSRFLDTQSDWYAAKAAADISKVVAETDSHTAKTYWQKVQNQYARGFAYEGYMKEMRSRQQIEVQILNGIKQGMLLDKDIASYDKRLNGELSEQLSRVALNYATKRLTLHQAGKVLGEIWTDVEKRIGMKIDNDIKSRTRDVVIERAKQPNNMYQLGFDGINGMVQMGKDFGNWIYDKSKRLWKDTKRSFGLYW